VSPAADLDGGADAAAASACGSDRTAGVGAAAVPLPNLAMNLEARTPASAPAAIRTPDPVYAEQGIPHVTRCPVNTPEGPTLPEACP
jgi:hypothetical protein